MTQIEITNPAARLRKILHRLASVSLNKTGIEVWTEVFNIQTENAKRLIVDMVLQLTALEQLFYKTISILEQIPNTEERLYIAPIKNLLRVLYRSDKSSGFVTYLANSFDSYRQYLNGSDMTALNFAVHTINLSGQFNEKLIPNEEIGDILADLENLYNSINESSLPVQFKTSLLELIVEMRQSVSEYDIRGSEALTRALTKSVGVLAVNKENIEKYRENPEVEELFSVISKIDDVQFSATNHKFNLLLNAASSITKSKI